MVVKGAGTPIPCGLENRVDTGLGGGGAGKAGKRRRCEHHQNGLPNAPVGAPSVNGRPGKSERV